MHIWSTCTACNTLMQVSDPGINQHPTCLPPGSSTGDPLVDAYLNAVVAGNDEQADQLEQAIANIEQRVKPLGPAALAYAAWGWPVFPLQPGEKTPFPKTRGLNDATTDVNTIRRWWRDHPNANIGLRTGIHFDALDVDFVDKQGRPTGAHIAWPNFRDSDELPDIHGIAVTPRGGQHLLLTPTGGGNMTSFLPGLDYRGKGGYIVAPPSRRADGRRYQWHVRPSLTITAKSVAA